MLEAGIHARAVAYILIIASTKLVRETGDLADSLHPIGEGMSGE
jgi:hypothetical protein